MTHLRAYFARRETLLVAAAMALAVVAWQQWLHGSAGGTHGADASSSPLVHWLLDGALALIPAFVAVGGGLWLAARIDRAGRTRDALFVRPACIALLFGALLVPAVGIHGAIDDAINGPGVEAIEAAPGAGYLPQGVSDGFWAELGHGARDALTAVPVAFVVAFAALMALSWRAMMRDAAASAVVAPEPSPVLPAALLAPMTKRDLLKYSGAGAAALALSSSGLIVLSTRRAHAAAPGEAVPWLTDDIELFMNDGFVNMIDGVPVYSWGWGFRTGGVDDSTELHVPGPVLWTNHGDTVSLTVTNTLDENHSFFIDGVVDSGVIAPGETVSVSFPAPPPGTYIYGDGLNRPVHRVLGLHGALIVMPADGSLVAHPDLDPTHWTFATQWVWIFNEIDPAFNARAQANMPIDPADFVERFLPRYFTINGRMGSLASHQETAPETVVHDRTGNPALIRIVNVGVAMHGPHFHGNHVFPIVENAEVSQNIPFKDTIRVMPEDRIDVFLPFEIPPNAVYFPPPESGRQFLEEIHGRDIDGSWPMHCHVEMSQTAGGGLYPQGLLTDWKVEL